MKAEIKLGVLLALLDTVAETTDMENVYNDSTDECYSWEVVNQAVAEMATELRTQMATTKVG